MNRLTARLRRFSRPIQIAIQVGVLVVIVMGVGTVGFIQYSGQPSFCLNCHIMRPYYDSWASSSHNDVKCIECHYAPGVKAEAMGKFQAANQVVKYVTGAYGSKPWAEIEDAACLRSGCHTERKLERPVDFNGIRFDHTEHLSELRRGKRLRCTSCHSQIVQGDHVAVTASTCYLCHFKDRPEGEPVGGCTGCHTSPPKLVSEAGFVVDHPRYVEDLTSCVSCHERVTDGSGAADRSRCFNCHNEPERIERFEDVTLVHRVHIDMHNVECDQCHMPIVHRVVSLAATFELDCNSCHQSAHEAQRRMYAGIGGHGTEESPSAMFLARVSCRGCHGLPTQVRGHEQVNLAGEATCLSCHGIRYANILPSWQEAIEGRVERAATVVRGARSALPTAPAPRRAVADSLIGLAEENIEFVRRGRGAHNIVFADKLLFASLDLVREAVEEGQLRYAVPEVALGTSLSENVCLRCHVGIEGQPVTFGGQRFPHEAHVSDGAMACSECHTPLDQHGGTTLAGPAACDACHHPVAEAVECIRCHAGAGGAPEAAISTATGDFPHAAHTGVGLTCNLCHSPPAMRPKSDLCEGCHEMHHQPEITCLSCHRGGVIDRHLPVAHDGCAACHGSAVSGITEWSRQVCTTCHADRVDHNAPLECVGCHQLPELGDGE